MKWITHQAGAVIGALALELSPLGIAAAFLGSVLPDVIDQKLSSSAPTARKRQKVFNRIHRGASHWFVWWLALFLACSAISTPYAREVAAGIALGGLSHVALDMLTSRGVPLLPFSKKGSISLHLCATGSWQEYVFLACIAFGGICLFYFNHWQAFSAWKFL